MGGIQQHRDQSACRGRCAASPPSNAPLVSGGSFDGILNRDNDPDLAKALAFDSECNEGAKHVPDAQSLAEKHYLAYLGRATDSALRARVYVQLGVLFATNYHPEFGEKPDYAKSVAFMNKALAEEPKRIGWATVRARLFRVTPSQSRDEQHRLRAANLEWLRSIDGRTLRERWLPVTPGQGPDDEQVRSFLSNLANVIGSRGQQRRRCHGNADSPASGSGRHTSGNVKASSSRRCGQTGGCGSHRHAPHEASREPRHRRLGDGQERAEPHGVAERLASFTMVTRCCFSIASRRRRGFRAS